VDERFAIHPSVRDGRTGRMLPAQEEASCPDRPASARDDRLACHRSRRVARAFTRKPAAAHTATLGCDRHDYQARADIVLLLL